MSPQKTIFLLSTLLILSLTFHSPVYALSRLEARKSFFTHSETPSYVPGEIVVTFKTDKSLTSPVPSTTSSNAPILGVQSEQSLGEFLQAQDVKTIKEVDSTPQTFTPNSNVTVQEENVYILKTNATDNMVVKSQELEKNPAIETAEPNYIAHTSARPNDNYYLDTQAVPNSRDPLWNPPYDYQWNLKQINIEKAWDITTGSSSVIIAVIDTGIDRNQPEFSGITIMPGKNYIDTTIAPDDDHGHGTHVSGIIASASNNAQGIAGINWHATILPLKALDETGSGTYANIVQSIRDAADSGARVINMSLGFDKIFTEPVLLNQAIDYAISKNVLVVAAAGNGDEFGVGQDMENTHTYPAYYAPVIAVSATTPDDTKASYSNFGTKVDVAAPGGEAADLLSLRTLNAIPDAHQKQTIETLTVGQNYVTLSGTSMATPHVAGLAALMLAKNPALTNTQLETIIKDTTDDLGTTGFDPNFGYGRINAYKALLKASANTGILGDINHDNKVDIQDYNTLVSQFNQTGTNLSADFNKSGKVDVQDYNVLVSNFGKVAIQ